MTQEERKRLDTGVNYTYFDKLTHNSAWLLGFLTADATLHSNTYQISINLSIKDIKILEFIKQELTIKNPIYDKKMTLKVNNKEYNLKLLKFGSKYLYNKLSEYHIIPCKTGKEQFPNIEKCLIPSYIRGYFDGDGSFGIYQYKNKSAQYNCQITCASYTFLESLHNIIKIGKIRKRSNNNCYDWVTNSKKDIIQFGDFIYSDNGFYLKRKKDIFNKIKGI